MLKHRIAGMLAIVCFSGATLWGQNTKPFDPQGRQQKHIDFLTTVLSLTDAQKQQASTIFSEAGEASAPLRDSLMQQHKALDEAVKSQVTDAQIDQIATTLGSLTGQLAAIRTKALARFYATLTPDQRQKLDQLQADRHGPGMMEPGFPHLLP